MDIKKTANNIIGTCDPEPEGMNDLSIEELELFESIAQRCSGCSYWVEPNEMSGNMEEPLCKECDE